MDEIQYRDKVAGVLLGTAVGDALGFVTERLDQNEIKKRFGKITIFRFLGETGFVTDDTEQSALIAASIARHPTDADACLADFRKALLLWFLCFPFGIGRATIQACQRIALGMRESGVNSAGNGAAMRAAIIGAYFDDPMVRTQYGVKLARVTHCDARAVEGALFVAELTAQCFSNAEQPTLEERFRNALKVVQDSSLLQALEKSAQLAHEQTDTASAAAALNGQPCAFILNSLPFCAFCFLRFGNLSALECLSQTVAGGGDTDTNAAIVGAWLGALKGEKELPLDLIARINDGPFGPTHLRRLADALTQVKYGKDASIPGYSLLLSALRNVLLVPIVVGHFFLRLIPPIGKRHY